MHRHNIRLHSYTVLGFILLLSLRSQGQNDEFEAAKIVAHSPNAASLGKYGDYPVDMSTGVPQINIPLYTIKSGNLELPISISYHAGGIKVDEESSFVGLGWALNAGGVITRVIKDRDDNSGFSTRYNQLPDYNSINAGIIGGTGNSSELLAEYNNYDKEPDLFIVNAKGIDSKFCMDNDGNFTSLDYEPFKYNVDYTNNLVTVTDKFGSIYRFGQGLDGSTAFETTGENYIGYQVNTVVTNGSVTSWYLTEIISADKADTIRFTYESFPSTTNSPGNIDRWVFEASPTDGVGDHRGVLHQGIIYGTREVGIPNARVINKIIFKNGSIQFNLIDDRQDVDAENLHQNVRIAGFSVLDNDNSLIKKIVFDNNNYFDRTASGSRIGGGSSNSFETKALKINGVKFYDSYNNFINGYQFVYNATPLPARFTTPQDLWGYYNGKPSTDFIPQNFYSDNSPALNQPIFIGSDRTPDTGYAKAAILQKITYPTGGSTSYEFEPNFYLTENQQASKTQTTKQISCFALNRLSSCAANYYNGAGPTTIYEFTVSEDLGGSTNQVAATLSFHFSDYINYSGTPMIAKFYRVGQEPDALIYQHTPDERANSKTISATYLLYKNATYRIELYTNGETGSIQSRCNSPFIEAYVSYSYWVSATPTGITPVQAGGLRTKSISNYDYNGNLLTRKTYEYGTEAYGPNAIGVGNLINDPNNNFYLYPELYATDDCTATLKYCLHFTSNSQTPLGFNHGSPVDYDKVTEKTVSTETGAPNGKTEYYYSRTGVVHEPADSYEHPYNYFYYPEWQSSALVKKVDYIYNQDGTYTPVRSVENIYSPASEKRIKTLKVLEYQPDTYFWDYCKQMGYGDNPNRFFFYNFYVSVGRNKRTEEITTDYVNGVAALTVEKNFEYNPSFEISKISTLSSKSGNMETDFKYTADLDYTTLKGRNMIAYPVLKNDFLNGNAIRGEILKYNDDGLQTEHYRFKSAVPVTSLVDYVTKDNVPYYFERRQSFGYSVAKRLQESITDNSIMTSYLWDYSNSYPIAEVTNSDSTSIAYTSFEADGTGNWTFNNNAGRPLHTGAVTGSRYLNLNSRDGDTISKSGLTIGNTYILSYWSSNGPYTITGGIGSVKTGRSISGDWTYYEHRVTASSSTITLSGSGNIDELRLYPEGAQMTSYTYSPLVGMTTMDDPNGEITYYEYDGLQRLKNIKDYQGNIIKNYQYNYANSCGPNCSVLPMQTFNATNTLSYPVGVFNVNGKLLGNAGTQAQYISTWMTDTADAHTGTITAASDSMHFNFTVNAGRIVPPSLTGCRYYQYDLAYNQIDAVRNINGCYVDFGDGISMRLGKTLGDTSVTIAPNTTLNYTYSGYYHSPEVYWVHTYPDSSEKTITLYHNDGKEYIELDNYFYPAPSLNRVRNLRGNIPQNMQRLSSSCFQDGSVLTVSGVSNWSSVSSIRLYQIYLGDGISTGLHMNYAQDCLANDKNLEVIFTSSGLYDEGYEDTTFKISRFKTDWNTYFTKLDTIRICDDHWSREDISALKQLRFFAVYAGNQKHSLDQTNNPLVPIPVAVIDNIINQISAGAGQFISNGTLIIGSGGTARSSSSDAAFNQLKSKGWAITINNISY